MTDLIILFLVIILVFRDIGDVIDKILSAKKEIDLTIKYSHKE